jgi:hypothetical protein
MDHVQHRDHLLLLRGHGSQLFLQRWEQNALQHSRVLRQSIQESKLHEEGPFRLELAFGNPILIWERPSTKQKMPLLF